MKRIEYKCKREDPELMHYGVKGMRWGHITSEYVPVKRSTADGDVENKYYAKIRPPRSMPTRSGINNTKAVNANGDVENKYYAKIRPPRSMPTRSGINNTKAVNINDKDGRNTKYDNMSKEERQAAQATDFVRSSLEMLDYSKLVYSLEKDTQLIKATTQPKPNADEIRRRIYSIVSSKLNDLARTFTNNEEDNLDARSMVERLKYAGYSDQQINGVRYKIQKAMINIYLKYANEFSVPTTDHNWPGIL